MPPVPSTVFYLLKSVPFILKGREIDAAFEYRRISRTGGILCVYASGIGRIFFIILGFVLGHCLRKTSRGVPTPYRFDNI